jgi:hypothetical protein
MWFLGAVLPNAPLTHLEAPYMYLAQVLAFHAANGGPFLHSAELDYAARRLARAWVVADLPRRVLTPFLAHAVSAVFPPERLSGRLVRQLSACAADECRQAAAAGSVRLAQLRLARSA